MIRFQVVLDATTFKALRLLSNSEYRDYRNQASFLIRESLENRGLIGNSNNDNITLLTPPEVDQIMKSEREENLSQ